MAITIAQVQTHVDVASVARGTGDFATAITKLEQALIVLGGLPDTDNGAFKIAWRADIVAALKAVNKSAGETRLVKAGGIRQTKVTFLNAGA